MAKSKDKIIVERNNTKPLRDKRGLWQKGTPPPNPKGAPKRGESWAEIIGRVGDMTPAEAATASLELSKQLLKIGEGVTLKEAVVLRVYGALLFDPNPGLLNAFMNRVEGMPSQIVTLKSADILNKKLEELGLTLHDVAKDPLALELFRQAGVVIAGIGEAGVDSGEPAGE